MAHPRFTHCLPWLAPSKHPALTLPPPQNCLAQENPDLFKWLTGQLPPSEQMEANWAFKVLAAALLIFP